MTDEERSTEIAEDVISEEGASAESEASAPKTESARVTEFRAKMAERSESARRTAEEELARRGYEDEYRRRFTASKSGRRADEERERRAREESERTRERSEAREREIAEFMRREREEAEARASHTAELFGAVSSGGIRSTSPAPEAPAPVTEETSAAAPAVEAPTTTEPTAAPTTDASHSITITASAIPAARDASAEPFTEASAAVSAEPEVAASTADEAPRVAAYTPALAPTPAPTPRVAAYTPTPTPAPTPTEAPRVAAYTPPSAPTAAPTAEPTAEAAAPVSGAYTPTRAAAAEPTSIPTEAHTAPAPSPRAAYVPVSDEPVSTVTPTHGTAPTETPEEAERRRFLEDERRAAREAYEDERRRLREEELSVLEEERRRYSEDAERLRRERERLAVYRTSTPPTGSVPRYIATEPREEVPTDTPKKASAAPTRRPADTAVPSYTIGVSERRAAPAPVVDEYIPEEHEETEYTDVRVSVGISAPERKLKPEETESAEGVRLMKAKELYKLLARLHKEEEALVEKRAKTEKKLKKAKSPDNIRLATEMLALSAEIVEVSQEELLACVQSDNQKERVKHKKFLTAHVVEYNRDAAVLSELAEHELSRLDIRLADIVIETERAVSVPTVRFDGTFAVGDEYEYVPEEAYIPTEEREELPTEPRDAKKRDKRAEREEQLRLLREEREDRARRARAEGTAAIEERARLESEDDAAAIAEYAEEPADTKKRDKRAEREEQLRLLREDREERERRASDERAALGAERAAEAEYRSELESAHAEGVERIKEEMARDLKMISARSDYIIACLTESRNIAETSITDDPSKIRKQTKEIDREISQERAIQKRALKCEREQNELFYRIFLAAPGTLKAPKPKVAERAESILDRIEFLLARRDSINMRLIELYGGSGADKTSDTSDKMQSFKHKQMKKAAKQQRSLAKRVARLSPPKALKEKIFALMDKKTGIITSIETTKLKLKKSKDKTSRRMLKKEISKYNASLKIVNKDIARYVRDAEREGNKSAANRETAKFWIAFVAIAAIAVLLWLFLGDWIAVKFGELMQALKVKFGG